MEDNKEKWNKFKEWVKNLSDDEFYEESVDCRQISFGSLENDNKEYFFNLLNAYAENKYEQQIEKMKCCANCKHSVEGCADCFENCGNCEEGRFACYLKAKQDTNGKVYFKHNDYNKYYYKCDKWELYEGEYE